MGYHVTHPRDTVERIHPRYFRTREKYLLYLRHVYAYEHVISQTRPNDRVLEIGFGEGYGTRQLADHVADTIAVDVDAETVRYAADKYGSANLRFEHYAGTQLPLKDESVDLVVALQVIEHIQDDDTFVAEAHRVLAPGGRFILTTPNRTHRIPEGQPPWNKFHVREYFPSELEVLLKKHFADAHVFGVGARDAVRKIEIARVRRGLSLKKLVPQQVRAWFHRDSIDGYSTADFHIEKDNVSDSLDLLGDCRKGLGTPTVGRSDANTTAA